MSFDGQKTAEKIKGWVGFALSLLPIISLIPSPAVQAIAVQVNSFILVLLGAGGVALQAGSPAIVGKNKP